MKRLALAVAVLAAAQLSASTNDAGWRGDVQYLTTELPKRHKNAFAHVSRSAFEAAAARLVADIPSLRDADVAVRVMQLAALLGDSHTFATGYPFANYPIALYWFDDGLYVIRASEAHADLLGARVVAVDGHDAIEVANAVSSVFPYENESWRRSQAPAYVVAFEVLRAMQFTDDEATFTFARPDGTTFERVLSADGSATSVAPLVPLARQHPELNYWAVYLEPERALFLRYNRCQNDPAKPFTTFLNETMAMVGDRPVDRFVVDLRDNPGGSSAVLQPLLTKVQATPSLNRADVLYVLIGRRTFSSALINAIQLDEQTNATLVGEPTGGKPNSYGEVLNFRLPFSNLQVWYSTKYFELLPGQDPPSLDPDVRFGSPAAPYFAGADPVLERVLAKPPRRRSARH